MFVSNLIGLILTFASSGSMSPQEPETAYREKTVLLLPVFNSTGEKWVELKNRISQEAAKSLTSELAKFDLRIVPGHEVTKIIEDSKIDFSDEENWKRENFYKLANTAKTEFVVFVVVTHATQRKRENLFSEVPEGDVTLKFWILNAKTKSALLSAKAINAKARSKTNLVGEAKGSDCQVEAARRAAKEGINEAFGPPKPPGG